MFHQIRIRLVVQNALVFFFILLVSGIGLYMYMQHGLMEQVDSSMKQTYRQFSIKQEDREPATIRPIGGGAVNLRVVYLFWSEDGKLVQQSPEQAVELEDASLFQNALNKQGPTTLHSTDHTYRVLTTSFKFRIRIGLPKQSFSDFPQEQLATTSPIAVSKVQFVRNIDTEQNILNRLLMVLIIGGILGGGMAVLAGFYLAGRALVPIRVSWEKQQQFVADASHELRTPLAVVQSHTELLLRHPDHTIAEESQKVAVIYKESKRMSKLVRDLLTLARTDSNQLEIQRIKLLLDQTLADVAEQFQQLAEVKDIGMQTHIADMIQWEADEERLRQLFVILLDNAIKFTPEGGNITVSCQRFGQTAEIVIEDTGSGIAPEELPFVFDRFYRGDKVRNSSSGGTGLGLSIAKWIVEAHQGKIRVESRLGSGTKIHMLFPLKKAETPRLLK